MKQLLFIRHNFEMWEDMEKAVEDTNSLSPDETANMYIELTSDLAFAQTHYAGSRIELYLNRLAAALHNEIYRNKREKWSRLITFWTHELPLTLYQERRLLLCSLIITLVSTFIGAVSQWADPEFCRVILGDSYVDMTLENIKNGTPMAVYNSDEENEMFLAITLNNIGVSFLAFAAGLLTCLGTGLILLQNGIMLGAFETFFAQHGLFWESVLAVFLHGTLEISAIIVAGAAGIALGNGFVFPGTYPRLTAFRRGAKRGLKIVVGTMPIFILAAFIEGFVTRHTDIADELRAAFILLSLAFVIFYFVVWPQKVFNNSTNINNHD